MAIACTKDLSIHVGGGYWTFFDLSGFPGVGTNTQCTSVRNVTSNTQANLNFTLDTGSNDRSGPVVCWDCNFPGGDMNLTTAFFGPFAVDTLVTITGALTLSCASTVLLDSDCNPNPDTTPSLFILEYTDGMGQGILQSESCTPAEGSKIVAINGSFTQHVADPPFFLRIIFASHGAGMFNQVNCGVTFTP